MSSEWATAAFRKSPINRSHEPRPAGILASPPDSLQHFVDINYDIIQTGTELTYAPGSDEPAGLKCAQESTMATLEYKGYIARIDADEDTESFHGRVINISDVVTFKGRSMTELKREFAKSMKVYFAVCREEGDEPEQPFSGKFVLRIDPAVHRAIARAAERAGLSINKWAATALEHAAERTVVS